MDGEGHEAPDLALERRLVDARPSGDAVTRAVWFSQVASALFGHADPVAIGRYRLERQLGRGGGGSVFVALDPELHRNVALKLIRCGSERHRERALAEARALAKLSHPNVVPVHDVGETTDHVYLVMELLRGESLRELSSSGRTVREIVAAYRQAAAGLAAAHAVGLVHRDFKPDNAMFGDDGRLRVVDFGLATDGEAGEGAAMGTPHYMAPEQRAGAPTDASVDQYSLATSLREAIGEPSAGAPGAPGRRAPAWLARVIARATAPQPGDRYPSMAALAQALGDDPRSRWKRRGVIVVPIALAVVAFGLGRGAAPEATSTCDGAGEALAPVWTPVRVDAVVSHVHALGTPFAIASTPLLRGRLDKLGGDWLAAYRRACVAHRRDELSSELYDRSAVCLARARIELGEALELVGTTDAGRLDTALGTLSVVDRAERCADPIALANEANPLPSPAMRVIDQQIAMAAIHARGATSQAVALARQAEAAARASGDPKLIARALLVLGHAYGNVDRAQAIGPLHEATLTAIEQGLDDVATEAFARHAYNFAQQHDEDRARALDGLELARALGQRAGDRGMFARALLSNNVGVVAMLGGDLATARVELLRAVRDATAVAGPGAVELVIATANLALVTVDDAERARLWASATELTIAAVGPYHPQAFYVQVRAVADGDDPAAVVAQLRTLCPRLAALHPALVENAEVCAAELAWQATALGAPELARDANRWLPDAPAGPRHARQLVRAYAALTDGTASRATLAELDELARKQVAMVARGLFHHLFAGELQLAEAMVARSLDDPAAMRRAASAAVEHFEAYRARNGVPLGMIERRLRWARTLR